MKGNESICLLTWQRQSKSRAIWEPRLLLGPVWADGGLAPVTRCPQSHFVLEGMLS